MKDRWKTVSKADGEIIFIKVVKNIQAALLMTKFTAMEDITFFLGLNMKEIGVVV